MSQLRVNFSDLPHLVKLVNQDSFLSWSVQMRNFLEDEFNIIYFNYFVEYQWDITFPNEEELTRFKLMYL